MDRIYPQPRFYTKQYLEFLSAFLLCLGVVFFAGGVEMQSRAASNVKDAIDFEFNGRLDAEILRYRNALKEQPDSVLLHLQLGQLLLDQKGDVDGAIAQFQAAIKTDPTCGSCRFRLENALLLKEAGADELTLAANQYYLTKQYKRAEALYHMAVRVDPQSAEAHNSLAWTLYKEGNLADAAQEVTEALLLKPNDPQILNTLGCIQYDKGSVEDALHTWNKAVSLSGGPSAADLYCIAVALISQGNLAGATTNFQKAVGKDSRYENPDYLRDAVGLSIKTLCMHDRLQALVSNHNHTAKQSRSH